MSTVNRSAAGRGTIVLAGVDFSALSQEVLRVASDLAREPGSELHCVHVRSSAPSESTAILSADRELGEASHIDELHVRFENLVRSAVHAAKRVVLHIRVGRADAEIAQLASDIEADLLVIGPHDRSGLRRFALGSVAESLVRNAPCSVLTLRSKVEPVWERITPPCEDCVKVQRETARAELWCARHREHHPRAHTYREVPESYGVGAQTFRGS